MRVLPRSRVASLGPPDDAATAPDAPPLTLRLAGSDADADGASLPADVVLWAAGAAPGAGALAAALGADVAGALATDDTLRVRCAPLAGDAICVHAAAVAISAESRLSAPRRSGHECIFALGDGAAVAGGPLAATAQVAFQAADYAAWNVWAAHHGRPLLPFRYQARARSSMRASASACSDMQAELQR